MLEKIMDFDCSGAADVDHIKSSSSRLDLGSCLLFAFLQDRIHGVFFAGDQRTIGSIFIFVPVLTRFGVAGCWLDRPEVK